MKNPWKTIKKNIIYQNKFGYTLREDDVLTPNNKEGKYMVLESHGFIGIVGVDENLNVVMENNWRYPIEEESLEIPAGTIEDNEDSLSAAKREFFEETGYTSNKWTLLSKYWTANGAMKIQGHIFLAQDIKTNNVINNPDKNEANKISLINFSELLNLIKTEKINEDRSIIGLLSAKEYLL